MASRTDRFIDSKFSARVNPKDGFAIVECKEARARRVLEFLVPLCTRKSPRESLLQWETPFSGLYPGRDL